MRTIHVILAIRQQLYCDLLDSMLSREDDVHIVTRVDDEFALVSALMELLDEGEFAVDDPVIIITSVSERTEVPASAARLLAEFPEITIVGICWATASIRSFQLRIDVQEIPCSNTGLISAIRACAGASSAW